tara:strand:- start:4615 stop:6600 length:1986 start_codon:yes stop_codon:yes gene_type:complete
MSFWSVDDKIPVRQTKVSVFAENGLDYKSSQKINFHLPPTIAYFQPKESYLEFDVQIKGINGTDNKPVRLSLDAETGAQSLIRDIRIMSGGAGSVLLEEIQNYNTLVALKYDYESNDVLRNKRALTEGSLTYDPDNRGTYGTTKSDLNNHKSQPYTNLFRQTTGAAKEEPVAIPSRANTAWSDDDFNKVKVVLPLHTGIFSNSKVFPALLTEGLRIEIILESAAAVLRIPDTINPARHANLGCQFHSITGKDSEVVATPQTGTWAGDASGDGSGGSATSVIYVTRQNNMTSVDNCPFVPGQKIAMCRNGDFNTAASSDWGGMPTKAYFAQTDVDMIIDTIELVAPGAATGVHGLLKISLAAPTTNKMSLAATRDIKNEGGWFVVDASVRDQDKTTGLANTTRNFNADYVLSNVQMVIQQIEMPSGYTNKLMGMMKGGGTMNYDFLSHTNYKYSQLKGDRVANIRLPLSMSRAKSILSIPTDGEVYSDRAQITGMGDTLGEAWYAGLAYPEGDAPSGMAYLEELDPHHDKANFSVRTGLTGCWDELSDYQWFYDGKLNPSRKIETGKISGRFGIQQQVLTELEKALAMGGIEPLSFRKFRSNACLGRALALQDGVYDCRGKDFNLQVNYMSQRAPIKNKLWHNFVAHLRRIEVKGDQISLQV